MADLMGRIRSSTPGEAWRAFRAVLRGSWWILYFRLARRDVRIHFPFKVHGPVAIEGPGSVSIGPGCRVNYNTFRGLSIVTLSPDARVHIGERANVGGLAVRCRTRVTIGQRVMTAVSLVQDFLVDDRPPAVETPDAAGDLAALAPRPVEIGDNVWLGPQSIVLAGARIGDDSVLSVGAVCHDIEAPAYSLMAGNPARRPLPIAQVLKLRRATS